MWDDLIFSVIGPLFGALFVIALAFFGTRWLAGRLGGVSSGRYITVHERLSLGRDESLMLVSVGERVYMLGVTPKGVTAIDTLNTGDLVLKQKDTPQYADFRSLLGALMKKGPGQQKDEGGEVGP